MKSSSSHAFVHQVLVSSLVAFGASGSIGLGTVWLRHQISIVANANRTMEARIAEVARHGEEIRTAIAEEQDVSVLLQRNQQWHLGLVPPSPDQVVDVAEDPNARLAAKRNRELFSGGVEHVSFRVALEH